MSTNQPRPSAAQLLGALSTSERTVGAGSALVIISTVLVWKSPPSATELTDSGQSTVTYGSAHTGLHSWGLLTLLIALLVLAYLFVRSPLFRGTITPPRLPVADPIAYLIAGVGEILTIFEFSSHYGRGSIKFGFLVALGGGALTVLGGYLGMRPGASAPVVPDDDFEVAGDGAGDGVRGGGPPDLGGGGVPDIRRGGPPSFPE